MGAFALCIADLANNYGVFFTASCVNNKLIFQFTTVHVLRLEESVLRIVGIHIIFRVRKLLHAVESPSKETAFFANSKRVSIAANYLLDLFRDLHFMRETESFFIEWCDSLSILFALTTLAECVVAHGPDLSITVKHDDMINARADHINRWHVFDEDRLIDDEFTRVCRFPSA